MKTMFIAFFVAAVIAVGAGSLLNASYQQTADVRFSTSGTVLRGHESGSNLVGKDWSGKPN
ncbi:MAG: hypothetical protein WCH83_14880 [Alphaproteobacteria bacterium]|jgi:DNA-binding transcriptional regulator of glucitol operon